MQVFLIEDAFGVKNSVAFVQKPRCVSKQYFQKILLKK